MCWSGEPGEPGVNGMNYPEMTRKERKEKLNKIEMSEIDRQIELFEELAENYSKNMSKDESISFLQRIGILDEKGDISDNYPNLKNIMNNRRAKNLFYDDRECDSCDKVKKCAHISLGITNFVWVICIDCLNEFVIDSYSEKRKN